MVRRWTFVKFMNCSCVCFPKETTINAIEFILSANDFFIRLVSSLCNKPFKSHRVAW